MTFADELQWTTLAPGVPDDVARLAARCLEADGGMPLASDPAFLRRRWALPEGERHALRTQGGTLLAAVAVCPTPAGPLVTGLVDPAARGRGVGARLLDHGLAMATSSGAAAAGDTAPAGSAGVAAPAGSAGVAAPAGSAGVAAPAGSAGVAAPASSAGLAAPAGSAGAAAPASSAGGSAADARDVAAGTSPVITVETESLTEAGAALFASRGFRQVFAEDVMHIDPSAMPESADWPDGTTLTDWSAESAERFHAAYEASFRDRPGFPGEPAAEWIAEYDGDDEFRPAWSVLATVPGLGDAGFVTAALGWIVQVGVVPEARGRGIGAALMRESLSRMAAGGATEAWLNVNVNNPGAAALYHRLGFADRGRRARFQR